MNKTTRDLEFEKTKLEILKLSGANINRNISNGHKKAWEYEYEEIRKRKRAEKFYMIGSICGILSLVLTLILNFDMINGLF